MNKKNNNKGFTLAELLIVVAIIAVLVAIAIPVFTSQLEKSRDSVSVANLRSAYAEAQTAALTATDNVTEGNVSLTMKTNGAGGASNVVDTIKVRNVMIKSQKDNDWSGLSHDLPFYDALAAGDKTGKHGDKKQNGYVTVTFTYNKAGDEISKVQLSKGYVGQFEDDKFDP